MNVLQTHYLKKFILSYILISCIGCIKKKQDTFHIQQNSTNHADTLKVGYTYWWPQTGPFIGNCGERYSLAFIGTVKQLQKETKETNHTVRKGVIRIDTILTSKKLKNQNFNGESLISSDCFHKSDINPGDSVIVFCYTYEGKYVSPGGKSILKIKNNYDPIVRSILQYIQSGQNPLSIKNDTLLWDNLQLGSELRQLISCKKMFLKTSSGEKLP